jgi:hypothetical protein
MRVVVGQSSTGGVMDARDDSIQTKYHWEYILASYIVATVGSGTALQVSHITRTHRTHTSNKTSAHVCQCELAHGAPRALGLTHVPPLASHTLTRCRM